MVRTRVACPWKFVRPSVRASFYPTDWLWWCPGGGTAAASLLQPCPPCRATGDPVLLRARRRRHEQARRWGRAPEVLRQMCINQEPVYLQRLLGLQHAGEAFECFDAAVTEKVLDVFVMERQDDRDEMRPRVSALRPAADRKVHAEHRAHANARQSPLFLQGQHRPLPRGPRRSRGRHGHHHAAAADQLPVVTLYAENEPAQTIDDGIFSSALRGHVLGSVPDEAVLESHIGGNPDISETITRIVAKLTGP
jgi:hypothetical protein